jgi:pimeloyl-ACP methyl ester carboxylesterase
MSSAILATGLTLEAEMPKYFVPTARPARIRSARRAGDDYGVTAQPDWRTIDWQAHMHTAEVGGDTINYVDIGSGPLEPIVFVHGLGGQWQNWLENIPRAAQERRVIALDLPGFGLSPMPRERITISGYGRTVNGLCEELGLGRVEVVGNSMGGYIAAEVAIQFPSRVDQLILVSAAGISSADLAHEPILALGRIATALVTWTAARDRAIAARPKTRHLALQLVARHPSRLKADLAYEGFFKGTGKPGFEDALRANLEYDFRDRLPEIGRPTLIVWGEKDSIIPVQDAQQFERLIPDSRKVVMEDTGHVAMAERPATFNDLMLSFLAEHGPAAAGAEAPGQSQVA